MKQRNEELFFDRQKFADVLCAARLRKGLSLRAAAKEIGVGFNTLRRVENASTSPRLEVVARIAYWCDVDLIKFLIWKRTSPAIFRARYPEET